MGTPDRAIEFAAEVRDGQFDTTGAPDIAHPMPMMAASCAEARDLRDHRRASRCRRGFGLDPE